MGDKLIMSQQERLRKTLFELIKLGQLSQKDASRRLRLSYRQTKRSYQRFLREGDAGLVHKSRGKASTRAYPADVRQPILALYETKYMDFGPTFASEKLSEEDGHEVHPETLRLWLKAAGLWSRKRKRKQHRTRRERRARFGELLQLDGSIHPWFVGIDKNQCLMNMVDDATGKTLSLMDGGETTHVAFSLLMWWIELHGIPMAVYVDLKSLFISPKSLRHCVEDALVEPEWLTHFSKGCKRLGIEVIKAYSPQAKGRVERNHAVYQDRFVKELKLKGIKTIAGANELLRNGFVDNLNEKFAKTPSDPQDAHIALCAGDNLNDILCWEYTRTVYNDWTIRFEKQYFQIKKTNPTLVYPKQKISVRRHLDGSITLWHGKQVLPYEVVEKKPAQETEKKQPHSYTSAKRGANSQANKSKTPWNQFTPNWLKKTDTTKQPTL